MTTREILIERAVSAYKAIVPAINPFRDAPLLDEKTEVVKIKQLDVLSSLIIQIFNLTGERFLWETLPFNQSAVAELKNHEPMIVIMAEMDATNFLPERYFSNPNFLPHVDELVQIVSRNNEVGIPEERKTQVNAVLLNLKPLCFNTNSRRCF